MAYVGNNGGVVSHQAINGWSHRPVYFRMDKPFGLEAIWIWIFCFQTYVQISLFEPFSIVVVVCLGNRSIVALHCQGDTNGVMAKVGVYRDQNKPKL